MPIKAVFKNVRLEGYQDTHLTSNIGTDRQYYLNCNIRGTVDFIFGNGVCYFDNCLLYLEDRNTANVIVAPSTSATNTYGYVFGNCTIDGAAFRRMEFIIWDDPGKMHHEQYI
jgi:pectin methylesterase-like acyl-CoA thioesterase